MLTIWETLESPIKICNCYFTRCDTLYRGSLTSNKNAEKLLLFYLSRARVLNNIMFNLQFLPSSALPSQMTTSRFSKLSMPSTFYFGYKWVQYIHLSFIVIIYHFSLLLYSLDVLLLIKIQYVILVLFLF